MDAAGVQQWCASLGLPVINACVLSGVVICTLDELLIRFLSMVKAVGKVETVARRFDRMAGSDLVVVQTSADVMAVGLPATIGAPGEAGPWRVHTVREEEKGAQQAGSQAELPAAGGRDFRDRVLSVLRSEGKEWSDLESLISPRPPVKSKCSELASALTSPANKWPSAQREGPCRKLRNFSGITPTPEGDKEYETWVEWTSQLLDERQCSDDEKQQRLVESVRMLTADVVRAMTFNQPSAPLAEYLDAMESAFGMTGSPLELMRVFQNMRQEKGEKISVYLFQLERQLNCLRRWGGGAIIQAAEVDKLRVDQIAKGAQPQDMIAWGL
ncbi:modulator of apoptosis 1-like [Mobula birostris]|uniref:modulator of apoptosis 1-like n=1 Tax=Mobula birostris TaxID=1983395 RepID=UPI003B27ED81